MKEEIQKSWGTVGLSRIHGGSGLLFGSDVETNDFMSLTIRKGYKDRTFNRDKITGSETIAEILLSPTQFAEMITLMNVGTGVPCTIRYTEKDGYIEHIEERPKYELIIEEREKAVDKAFDKLVETTNILKQLINEKKIGKGIGEELINSLSGISGQINGSAREFSKNNARREINKMVVEAKTNIQSYVDYKVYQAGLETIYKESLLLENKKDNKDIGE